MDVLADVLRSLRLRNQVQGRLELSAPWGMRVEPREGPAFYAVSRGSCLLDIDEARYSLAAGDFVLLPRGRAYTLRDSDRTRAVPVAAISAMPGGRCQGVIHHGGGGAPTTIISGCFGFDGMSVAPIAASLPALLHVRADGASTRWLSLTMEFIAAEAEAALPGYETVAGRLGDVLFVHALRAHLASLPEGQTSWLRALVDPRIGPVLQRIHDRPAQAWTLAALAKIAGMSRSVFAARFKAAVGEAPLAYLTQWRMHRASELLASGDEPIGAVAAAAGYETESAFGKAFRRHFGETPGAHRRRRGPGKAG